MGSASPDTGLSTSGVTPPPQGQNTDLGGILHPQSRVRSNWAVTPRPGASNPNIYLTINPTREAKLHTMTVSPNSLSI